ncbi:EAL domain-containing protein [Synechocystis sp. PCC 7509]|uniref:EAL domain-containing protein n=1 Tax=Synechocystis sp. PCC 7509 TaxID=927677 RepID=UPI0002ABCA03|nr:EAL domain-containing protein [Synechocystis sp. PCC 7509]
MTLRKKTLLLVVVTTFCLIAVLYIISTNILLKGFRDVEAQNARENVQRVMEVYTDELSELNLLNSDWAEWDITYNFIENYNSNYIKENLNDATLIRGDIDLIAYINNQQQLVFGKFIEPTQAQSQAIAAPLQQHLIDTLRQSDRQQTGILLLPTGAMMISARNIFNSQGTSSSRGILLMGRYLDIEQLAKQTRSKLTTQRYDVKQIPLNFQAASQEIANNSSIILKIVNKDTIAGFSLLKGIEGKPTLLLRVDTPRVIYRQGTISTRYIGISLCTVGLIFGLLTLFWLETLVLSRLTRLTTGVNRIANSGNLPARVIVSGKDELSHLGNNINLMLHQLYKFHKTLQQSEERYRAFFAQSSEGIWRCELQHPLAINCTETEQLEYFCKYCYLAECNNILAYMLGYNSVQDLIGISINDLLINCVPLSRKLLLSFIYSNYRIVDREFYQLDKQGNKRYFLINLLGIVENGKLVRIWGMQHDITERKIAQEALIKTKVTEAANLKLTKEIDERKRIEQALFQEKELAQVTLQSIGDAVITTDANNKIKSLNPVAERLTNWQFQEAEGLPLGEVFTIIDETTRTPIENFDYKSICAEHFVDTTENTLLISRDRTEFAIDYCAAPIFDSDRAFVGNIFVFRDVTQSRRLSQQLAWQANHDPLTQLLNRRHFEQLLQAAVVSNKTAYQEHTLCYLDLDQFKIINDTCGHFAGDQLLCQVSVLFQRQLRNTDVLARLGGDEFGLLLYNCSVSEAAKITNILRLCLEEFRFVWQEKTFAIGVSIGLVAINDNQNLIDILRAADAACYTAKNRGRNQIYIYQPNRSETDQIGEMQWISILPKALLADRFCLYSQPIIPIQNSKKYQHWEILLRLKDDTGKIISPMAFIPAAERYNLMHLIDRWVISTLFAYLERGNIELKDDANLYAINLSGASINDINFISFIHEQFSKYNIPPTIICFEITETVAITNLTKAAQLIEELKTLGCQFSLDDFGSGMSSFAYLKNLPVDYIKIDGVFIKDIEEDAIASAMVEAIIRIASVMGIQTIAEFVENEQILQKIKTLGIDYAQGYGIAKPSPLDISFFSVAATSSGVLQLKNI